MSFETTLSHMQNIHQTITINDAGIPTYPTSSNYHPRITGVDTDAWDVWGPMSKRIFKPDSKGIPEQIKKDMPHPDSYQYPDSRIEDQPDEMRARKEAFQKQDK